MAAGGEKNKKIFKIYQKNPWCICRISYNFPVALRRKHDIIVCGGFMPLPKNNPDGQPYSVFRVFLR